MGDNMSKRLKLVTTSESEMEERSFVNPFPDWDQGVFSSSNSGQDSDGSEPFDANGKAQPFMGACVPPGNEVTSQDVHPIALGK
ncbi:hypothetical protein AALO_G00215700 [Alosa alosa]|uniref:Uncharacterized protein n=1 Tax=Alosa alosa TaxID=278164 RepID=A0AAV6G1L4_9TELE|nr:hypothetical protein AALO_G00215700 [Alosa alosa]